MPLPSTALEGFLRATGQAPRSGPPPTSPLEPLATALPRAEDNPLLRQDATRRALDLAGQLEALQMAIKGL